MVNKICLYYKGIFPTNVKIIDKYSKENALSKIQKDLQSFGAILLNTKPLLLYGEDREEHYIYELSAKGTIDLEFHYYIKHSKRDTTLRKILLTFIGFNNNNLVKKELESILMR